MAFRDDRQRGQVCWMLCSWFSTNPWELTDDGYRPTRYRDGARLCGRSTGEEAMVRFARALWSGDDLVIHLGWDQLRMFQALSAILAMNQGPDAVDQWLRDVAWEKVAAAPTAAQLRQRSEDLAAGTDLTREPPGLLTRKNLRKD